MGKLSWEKVTTETYESSHNCVRVCKDLCLQNKLVSLIGSDAVYLACYVEGIVDLKEMMQ